MLTQVTLMSLRTVAADTEAVAGEKGHFDACLASLARGSHLHVHGSLS